ncbi:hypothetical protein BJ986_000668 [Phycicoccus badiiscoriae]|uniref:Bacteriocin biosynthesis cyclodehydratase domain-containing protein n=1 Tax=Pedococcus badiiscoriae TaxID=642776 RepID=A0A852WFF0_9MICO|nr:hypothetical protein [Pedococcus badiiscoriae]NYG06181.1 hypothetical protein [Pedococcus badiiscoriae]
MTGRPLLKTVWPVLQRGSGCVQFGTDPDHAVVLDGLRDDEVTALQSLDGTRAVPESLRSPAGQDLLDLLLAHGLVVEAGDPVLTARTGDPVPVPPAVRALLTHDAQALLRTTTPPLQGYAALARRRAAHLFVVGRGSLPSALAAQLRHAGVGTVRQGVEVADDWEQSLTGRPEPPVPALVVLVGSQALDASAAGPWRVRGIPVVPVVLHGLEAVVGPVVVPHGPCLRCLDLARADRDPGWPALLGQLVPARVGAGTEVSGETTLVGLATSMTAMVALAVLDGQVLPVGRSLEVSLPWPRVRQRQWEVHPRCGCRHGSDTSGRPADVGTSAQARMAG